MELRTLRYFVHVAEARSFSKASVFLRVAQPALSRHIRKLEDEIGMPLFVRAGHHLELTEAGSLLLNRAICCFGRCRTRLTRCGRRPPISAARSPSG